MVEPVILGDPDAWTTLHTDGQWKFQVYHDGKFWRVVNLGSEGQEQFYVIAPKGPYRAPHKFKDPYWALPIPSECVYQDGKGNRVNPDQDIGGVIIKDENGQVVDRLSLSNPEKREDPWVIDAHGVLTYKGTRYYLRTLLMENKTEVTNYVAYFWAVPPEGGIVQVLEMEDLPL